MSAGTTNSGTSPRWRRPPGSPVRLARWLPAGDHCASWSVGRPARRTKIIGSGSLDKAGFAIIASGLKQCIRNPDSDDAELDPALLEKLFLSLA